MFRDSRTVIIKYFTDEIRLWLNENMPEEGRWYVQKHTVRTKCSNSPQLNGLPTMGSPAHPMGDDYRYDGWEIMFKGEADAVFFKLTFQDEIGKYSSESFRWDVV